MPRPIRSSIRGLRGVVSAHQLGRVSNLDIRAIRKLRHFGEDGMTKAGNVFLEEMKACGFRNSGR